MTQLTVYQLRRKIESIKEANRGNKSIVIVEMWCPESSLGTNGKAGLYRFDTRTPHIKTPVGE